MVVALSERTDFVGGEILVSKTPHALPVKSDDARSLSEDGYAEDEEPDESQQNAADEDLVQKEIHNKMLKYAKLSRFTPDKSSLVLIQGNS